MPLLPPPQSGLPVTTTPALAEALGRVGDRWALLVVAALLDGPRRFSDLLAGLPGLAPNVLSQRLKTLERHGVVVGRPYLHRPRRLAYELSGSGRELAGALRLLAAWGAGAGQEGSGPTHAACGTALEVGWRCPTCGSDVPDPAVDDLRYA